MEKKKIANSANPYYKINYPVDSSAFLVYNDNGMFSNYYPEKMYLFGLVHYNITGLTDKKSRTENKIIGEVVIEHKNTTIHKTIYLCFFIKQPESSLGSTNSTIDGVVNMINSGKEGEYGYKDSFDKFDLTRDLPPPTEQKFIKYVDNKDESKIIFILTKPVTVALPTSKIIQTLTDNPDELFTITAPTNYVEQTATASVSPGSTPGSSQAQQPNINGPEEVLGQYNKNDIYIDCQPTGVSLEHISTYNLPIGSAFSKEMQGLDIMKTSVNLFLFSIGLMFIYFGVPMLFKMTVIDKVLVHISGDIERKKKIRSAEIFALGFLSFFILSSFYYGFQGDGDYELITQGLVLFVVLALSVSLIMISKLNKEYLILRSDPDKKIVYKDNEELDTGSFTDMKGVFAIASSILGFMTSTEGALLYIIVADFFVFMILITLAKGDFWSKKFQNNCIKYLFIDIPIIISFLVFLSQP